MGTVLVLVASVPAYLAAGVALLLGAGWSMALMVLVATGVTSALALAALAAMTAPEKNRAEAPNARSVNAV